MKKLKIMALTAVMALSCTFNAFASSSKPTQFWYLGGNPYSWSAYINGYNLYSNYVFGTYDGNFGIHGEKLYPCSKTIKIWAYNNSLADEYDDVNVTSAINEFWYSTDDFDAEYTGSVYIMFDGTTFGAEASLEGTIETYLGE